jgi:hypothetical protein
VLQARTPGGRSYFTPRKKERAMAAQDIMIRKGRMVGLATRLMAPGGTKGMLGALTG